jgi:hypothetical protein
MFLSKRTKTKIKLNKTFVCPIITYDAETWTLERTDEHSLCVFEMKIIWRIYEPTCIEGNWKIRTNKEIDELIGHEDMVNFVKSLGTRWLGHVEIMNNNGMPKMILNIKIKGRKRRGCPRKHWLDAECGIKSSELRNWR